MRMYDIIGKKKLGYELTAEELEFFVRGYTAGDIPDYQAAAFCMAVYFRGMTDRETAEFTLAIMNSGDTIDLTDFGSSTVDKHSTGGVGDKTSLIVAPIAASLGCTVAKMTGRGLGHTGGTVDKLSSFPGYRLTMSTDELIRQVREIGVCLIGQSADLAPADKKLYALRDVTATVDSVPLIASSIMGKKLAAGAKNIVLDVKIGSGGFMKTEDQAEELARSMVSIGEACGRNVRALITDMDRPLGSMVGNIVEVKEAISVLKNETAGPLREICTALAANMAALSLGLGYNEAVRRVNKAIDSGAAFEKFCSWISTQGGDASLAEDTDKFPRAKYTELVRAPRSGYIVSMDTEKIGLAAAELGAGRKKIDDDIDLTAGIRVIAETGSFVVMGEPIAELMSSGADMSSAEELIQSALEFGDTAPAPRPMIFNMI